MHLALVLAVLCAAPEPGPLEIAPHERAFFIETSSVLGASMVRAKDHVDVIAAVTDPATKQPTSFLLLQNVVVLSNAAGVGGVPHLALLVIPEEAQLLALIKATGQLTVIQRNPDDLAVVEKQTRTTLKAALP